MSVIFCFSLLKSFYSTTISNTKSIGSKVRNLKSNSLGNATTDTEQLTVLLSNTRNPTGTRILTAYLYLNEVEEGGGTDFPGLGVTVMPKRGRVLIWPSVMDDDPLKKDKRTDHQALPVKAGIKYGANAWFHMRDFKVRKIVWLGLSLSNHWELKLTECHAVNCRHRTLSTANNET